ncbi:MAG: endopeptidase La [Mycoplasmoidaceae bacterium]
MSENKKKIEKKPVSSSKKQERNKLPLLVTRGIILFPGVVGKIEVGRPKSVKAVNESIAKHNGLIIILSQKDPSIDNPKIIDLYNIGTLCKASIEKMEDKDNLTISLSCIKRIKMTKIDSKSAYDEIEFVDYKSNDKLLDENKKLVIDLFDDIKKDLIKDKNVNFKEVEKMFTNAKVDSNSIDFLCSLLSGTFSEKQSLLELLNPNERLNKFIAQSIPDSDTQKIEAEISKKINKNLSKQQKEFYLRERIKTIKEELGDITSKEDDADKLKAKVKNNPYPDHIRSRLLSEINRMEISSNSNESSIIKTYIDWLIDLPWWQTTEDVKDIKKVEKILDKNHYGLEKVKERIIEYLAVRMKSLNSKGSIICLVGAPGVGKTSLAQSIAEALNKKFAKVSLGGMRDEAEIKGHRKTYIGSMPGRIIKEMKKVGVLNPLFLLDEIDKLSSDQRGDPASTLLDILDSEQNSRFSDNYIEEDYDLSKVLFLATANYEENIPEPLRDRLEIIRLDSYTDSEKISITERHLIPKILEESNLTKNALDFSRDGINYILKRYTREAGVREVERKIREITRKFVLKQLKDNLEKDYINVDRVKYYLKKEIFDYTSKDDNVIAGIVNGMAYTSYGGDLLPIEVTYYKGKGKIHLTGNLKETMKESAEVALAYVRSNAEKYGINPGIFEEIDIHIHVPSGGIPKDGPSAGVALTTAIISRLTNRPVPTNIAMTGEITLRGKVLIIGGVKEKTISAVRGGVNKIFLPKEDERYIDDIPNEILKKVEIRLVSEYHEIYDEIFMNKKEKVIVKKIHS